MVTKNRPIFKGETWHFWDAKSRNLTDFRPISGPARAHTRPVLRRDGWVPAEFGGVQTLVETFGMNICDAGSDICSKTGFG